MKKFKKTFAFITAIAMLLSIQTIGVSAAPVEVGNVLYTANKLSINGSNVPLYALDTGKSYVVVSDLTNYGFEVVTDPVAKTATVAFNAYKTATPLPVTESVGTVGKAAFRYFTTEWKVYISGRQIECFNIAGRVAIASEELKTFGTYVWDGSTNTSKLTTGAPAPSKAGTLTQTSYSAFIRTNRIPAYGLNGNVVVLVRDLVKYGFALSGTSLTYNPNAGVNVVAAGQQMPDYYNASAYVTINGNRVDTWALSDGSYVVRFSVLDQLGNVSQNGTTYTFTPFGETSSYTITGKITDYSTGNGIYGATVSLWSGSGTMPMKPSVTTNASGDYTITDVAAGSGYFITVSATNQGYGSYTSPTFSVTGNYTRSAQLSKAATGTVTGKVTNQSGAAVTSATVRLVPSSGTSQTATTNSSGTYTFSNITAGNYSLEISATGYLSQTVSSFAVSGSTVTKNVTLQSTGYVVSGRLYSQGLSVNINNVPVYLRSGSQYGTVVATAYTTDSYGTFSFAGIANGTYYVTVNAQSGSYADSYVQITVNGRDYTNVSLTLGAASGAIRGTISWQNYTVNTQYNLTITAYANSNYTSSLGTATVTPAYNGATYSNEYTLTLTGATYANQTVYLRVTYYDYNSYTQRTYDYPTPVQVSQSYTQTANISITAGYTLSGTITGLNSGESCRVDVYSGTWGSVPTATTTVTANGSGVANYSVTIPSGWYGIELYRSGTRVANLSNNSGTMGTSAITNQNLTVGGTSTVVVSVTFAGFSQGQIFSVRLTGYNGTSTQTTNTTFTIPAQGGGLFQSFTFSNVPDGSYFVEVANMAASGTGNEFGILNITNGGSNINYSGATPNGVTVASTQSLNNTISVAVTYTKQ